MQIKNIHVLGSAVLIILLFSFYLFGSTGLRTMAGLMLIFIVPTYLILSRFSMETDEKIFFAFFIGLAWFAFITYYVNRIVPSLKLSMLLTFALAIAAWFLIPKLKAAKSVQ